LLKIITATELSKRLTVTKYLISSLVQKGEIPFKQIGRSVKFTEPQIVAWLLGLRKDGEYEEAIDSDSSYTEIPSDWMKPQEVAEWLGVCVATVRNYRKRGVIPFYMFTPSVIRYRKAELEAWGM